MQKSFTVPRPIKRLIYTGLIVFILFNVLLLFALDNSPLLKMHQGLNRDDIQRAKQLLQVKPEEHNNV